MAVAAALGVLNLIFTCASSIPAIVLGLENRRTLRTRPKVEKSSKKRQCEGETRGVFAKANIRFRRDAESNPGGKKPTIMETLSSLASVGIDGFWSPFWSLGPLGSLGSWNLWDPWDPSDLSHFPFSSCPSGLSQRLSPCPFVDLLEGEKASPPLHTMSDFAWPRRIQC